MNATDNENESLWGELPTVSNYESPASILKRQADELTRISKGVLVGRLVRSPARDNDLCNELRIVVPALGNYSVSLLSLYYPVKLYPAYVSGDAIPFERTVEGTNELKNALREVFQSSEVREILTALIAQANEAEVEEKVPF